MKKTAASILLFLVSTGAAAHSQWGGGLAHGFVHPFTGVDHLAAMLLVGACAARSRGASRLILPAAFLAGMVVGALAARAGAFLPAVEPVLLASAVVLAAALVSKLRVPAGAALAAAFGVFHGFAHIAGLPAEMPFALFTGGMLTGSALLHATGLAIGLAVAAVRPRVA